MEYINRDRKQKLVSAVSSKGVYTTIDDSIYEIISNIHSIPSPQPGNIHNFWISNRTNNSWSYSFSGGHLVALRDANISGAVQILSPDFSSSSVDERFGIFRNIGEDLNPGWFFGLFYIPISGTYTIRAIDNAYGDQIYGYILNY